MDPSRYPNEVLLVGADRLGDRLRDRENRIVEVRPVGRGYVFGYIPCAPAPPAPRVRGPGPP